MTSPMRKAEESQPPLSPPPGRTSSDDTTWYLRIATSSTSAAFPSVPRSPSPSTCISPAPLPSPTAAAAGARDRSTSPTLGSESCSPEPTLPPATLTPACPEHYVLLSGSLADLAPYSDGLVDWLLDIAQLAFGPYEAGVLRCHRDDTAAYWCTKALEPSRWRDVKRGEAMEAKVYEFTPDVDGVTVSPRCVERFDMSAIAKDDGISKEFGEQLVLRDVSCVVTDTPSFFCDASHLIPTRLGNSGIQEIVRRFQRPKNPAEDWMTYHTLDPRIGVLAAVCFGVHQSIVGFTLGFKATGIPHTYTIHGFWQEGVDRFDNLSIRCPIMHGTDTTFPPNQLNPPPPPLVLDWHYLQCAFQRFGTAMSMEPSRCYYVEPPGERNEDEDEEEEEEDEPSYPSARAEAVFRPYLKLQQREHLEGTVTRWNEGVGSWAETLL